MKPWLRAPALLVHLLVYLTPNSLQKENRLLRLPRFFSSFLEEQT
jgi:hypothetical protein